MFLFSVLMIFISSYLLLSIISPKIKKMYGYLYFILISFAQIIISFEILSIFNAITRNNFLIFNFAFLIFSILLFVKTNTSFYVSDIENETRKIKNALLKDRILMICAAGFCIYTISQLITIFFYPIFFGDALGYYFSRAISWICQGNFNHFSTNDVRELIMPIDFDMLYMWHFLFLKTEKGAEIYSYIGYSAGIYVIYNFIKELGFSLRTALWSVFVYSSFSIVLIESVNACAELSAGSLIAACVFLFLINVKHNDKASLYFSTLALALAFGVKTTTFMTIPSVLFLFLVILLIYKPEKIKQKIFLYFCLFTLNFLIFSSYNYILNFIQFQNPVSTREQIMVNSLKGGFKAWFCNILKYSVMIFDTSGIPLNFINKFATAFQTGLLKIFGFDLTSFESPLFPNAYFKFTPELSVFECLFGATGLFVLFPASVKSCIMLRNKPKNLLIFALNFSYVINIAVLSAVMVFTPYNNKYIATFVVILAPVLVYSYTKRRILYKLFASLLLLYIFVFIFALRFVSDSKEIYTERYKNEENGIYKTMKILPPGKTALIAQNNQSQLYFIHKLAFEGFIIDKIIPANIKDYNLNDYKYIIAGQDKVISSVLPEKTTGENCFFVDVMNKRTELEDNKNVPVAAVCYVPHKYFAESGYKFLFETPNYIVSGRE